MNMGHRRRYARLRRFTSEYAHVERLEERQLLAAHVAELATAQGGWVSGLTAPYQSSSFTRASYFINIDASGQHAYTAATDSNLVSVYDLNSAGGYSLTGGLPKQTISSATPNIGQFVRPHSLTISPDGFSVYVLTQGADATGAEAAMFTFDRNTIDGTLTLKDAWTIRANQTPAGDGIQGAAEVRVTGDGKFIYVTGRNDDAVVVFARSTTAGSTFGQPTAISGGVVSSADLDGTRGLALSPFSLDGGRHIYVTARDADKLLVVTGVNHDLESGTLGGEKIFSLTSAGGGGANVPQPLRSLGGAGLRGRVRLIHFVPGNARVGATCCVLFRRTRRLSPWTVFVEFLIGSSRCLRFARPFSFCYSLQRA